MTKEQAEACLKPNHIYEISFTCVWKIKRISKLDRILAVIKSFSTDIVILRILVNANWVTKHGSVNPTPSLSYKSIQSVKEVNPKDLPLYIGLDTTPYFDAMFRERK